MFQGFPQSVVDFMWGIRFNNEKSWFEQHKQEYLDTFQRPMKALCDEVYERFTDRHPDLDLIAKVSRIYRDARRLFGRGPYKDHLWLSIHQPLEHPGSLPTFWFELEPEGYSYGMGFWEAPALTMAKLRARMDREPKPMEKLALCPHRHGLQAAQARPLQAAGALVQQKELCPEPRGRPRGAALGPRAGRHPGGGL